MNSNFKFHLLIYLVFLNSSIIFCLECKDKNNQRVSWINMIKLPQKSQQIHHYIHYSNLDQNTRFNYNEKYIDSNNEPLDYIYKQFDEDTQILAWNDEKPDSTFWWRDGAHAKGLIAYDSQTDTGIALIHSVPRYPSIAPGNKVELQIGKSHRKYGQNFLCMTLSGSSLNEMAEGLILSQVHLNYVNWSSKQYEFLYQLSLMDSEKFLKKQKQTRNYIVKNIEVDGQYISHAIFKNPDYNVCIFQDIMVPYFKISFKTETWGRPYEKSICDIDGQYYVKNIQKIIIGPNQEQWESHYDHSKWAISDQQGFICSGDMNHMTSQKQRGGAFYCIENQNMWKAYNELIFEVENCKSEEKRKFIQ